MNTRSTTHSFANSAEAEVGRLLLADGLISSAQLGQALLVQKKLSDQGRQFSLKKVLIQAQIASGEAIDEALQRAEQSLESTKRPPVQTPVNAFTNAEAASSADTVIDLNAPDSAAPLSEKDNDSALQLEAAPEVIPADFKATVQIPPPINKPPRSESESRRRSSVFDQSKPAGKGGKAKRKMLGPYEILGKIGRGGMGTVAKGRHHNLGRVCAIKMLKLDFKRKDIEELMLRFEKEAQTMAKLTHPNIVPIFDVGSTETIAYIAMEFVDGGSMADWLDECKRFRAVGAAEMMVKIARAIDHAHQLGIIHRDIKPANILLDQNEEPKVADFGLARLLNNEGTRLSKTGSIVGTLSYMPPEQIDPSHAPLDHRCDIYSMGATLYEMLTGEPPFSDKSSERIMFKVMFDAAKDPLELRPSLPTELVAICMKCLEKDPRDRYQSAGELAEDLGRFLRKEPVLARPPSSFTLITRQIYDNRALVAVSCLALFLFLALGGAAAKRKRQLAEKERLLEQREQELERLKNQALLGDEDNGEATDKTTDKKVGAANKGPGQVDSKTDREPETKPADSKKPLLKADPQPSTLIETLKPVLALMKDLEKSRVSSKTLEEQLTIEASVSEKVGAIFEGLTENQRQSGLTLIYRAYSELKMHRLQSSRQALEDYKKKGYPLSADYYKLCIEIDKQQLIVHDWRNPKVPANIQRSIQNSRKQLLQSFLNNLQLAQRHGAHLTSINVLWSKIAWGLGRHNAFEAKQMLETLLKQERSAELYLAASFLYYNCYERQSKQAIEYINKAQKMRPYDPSILTLSGIIHLFGNQKSEAHSIDLRQARLNLTDAIRLNSKNSQAYRYRSFVNIQQGQLRSASADLNQVRLLNPRNAWLTAIAQAIRRARKNQRLKNNPDWKKRRRKSSD